MKNIYFCFNPLWDSLQERDYGDQQPLGMGTGYGTGHLAACEGHCTNQAEEPGKLDS